MMPLQVLHVIDSLGRGGAERNLVNLIAAGDRASFRHHIVVLYADDALADTAIAAGASVSVLGGSGPRSGLSAIRKLVATIGRVAPDVVHTQLVISDLVGRASVLLGRRRPVVSTLQNRPYDPTAIRAEIPRPILAAVLRHADRWLGRLTRTRYIAVSEAVKVSYIRDVGIPAQRVSVIYNSVDLREFSRRERTVAETADRRAALGLPTGPLLLSVARHTPQKGLLDLVTAVGDPALRARGVRLALVGAGPETGRIRERVAALGLGDAVCLLGVREDVRELMELADVFVLPSIYEGLPLALLEALAVGVPVVASDLAEIREAATADGARLVPPGQPVLLAGSIASLLRDDEGRARMVRVGREQVAGRFSLLENVRRFEAILREVVRPDGGGVDEGLRLMPRRGGLW